MEKGERNFLNCMSFYALVGIGIVLILTNLPFLKSNLSTIIQSIANLIAYGILSYNGFYYVRKKTTAYKIIYAVALTLVVVGIILPIINVFAK